MGNTLVEGINERNIKKSDKFLAECLEVRKQEIELNKMIIESNNEHLKMAFKATISEYEILKENMLRAESEAERQDIRNRMREMKQESDAKDSENKKYNENIRFINNIFSMLFIVVDRVYKSKPDIKNPFVS